MSAHATLAPRRALLDVAVQLGGRVLNLGLGIVVTALIARALGGEDFGRWSTIFVVVQIARYFTDAGLEQVTVQGVVRDPAREPEHLGALVALRAMIAVPVTLACAGATLVLLEGRQVTTAGLIVSATVLLAAPGSLHVAFQLRVRNDLSVVVMTLNSVLWTGAVIAIAASHGRMVPLAVAFLGVAVLTVVLEVALTLRLVPVRFRGSRALWSKLLRVGVPIAIGGLLILAYGRIDQVIVFEQSGARQAGLYAAVYRILDQVQFLPIAITTTLFPLMAASASQDRERIRRLVTLAGEYLAMASLGVLAVTLVAAAPIVRFLFGREFADAAPALPILMGAFAVICFGYLSGQLVVVYGLQRTFIRYALVALVVNVALNLLLVPRYGFLAAAWLTLGTELLVTGLAGRAVLRAMGFRPPLGRMLRTVPAAAVLALGLAGLRASGAPLAVLLVAAALAYPALLTALRVLDLRELAAVLWRRQP